MSDRTCSLDDCERKHEARGLCKMHWKQQHGKPNKLVEVACTNCGQAMMKDANQPYARRYCSYQCRSAHRASVGSTWQKARPGRVHSTEVELHPSPQRRRRPPAAKQRKARVFFAGTCQSCGAAFISTTTAQTCSPDCALAKVRNDRSEIKHRRRARKVAAFVAPVYRKQVFERDKWRCQICNLKVNRHAVVPHPRAPTLDHIIPLACGGSHEPANVRLACFLCNAQRGDRGGWEQLALIG